MTLPRDYDTWRTFAPENDTTGSAPGDACNRDGCHGLMVYFAGVVLCDQCDAEPDEDDGPDGDWLRDMAMDRSDR